MWNVDLDPDELESYQSFNRGSYKVWCSLSKDQFDLHVENESYETKSRGSIIPLSRFELTIGVIAWLIVQLLLNILVNIITTYFLANTSTN